MRVLGSAVLAFEAIVMGFALLLAMDAHGAVALSLGGALAIAMLLTPGVMKKKTGRYLGTIWQFLMIAYGVVVPAMYFVGGLFFILWVCALYFGAKAERIRAEFEK
jgi:Protein of unknown function (DUF4233)